MNHITRLLRGLGIIALVFGAVGLALGSIGWAITFVETSWLARGYLIALIASVFLALAWDLGEKR